MKLHVFLNEHGVESEEHLRRILMFRKEHWGAFWWLDETGAPVMGLFINGDQGSVYADDGCAWSSNPEFSGGVDDTVQFMIETGQIDDFPASTILPASVATEVFVEFYKTGERSKEIDWE